MLVKIKNKVVNTGGMEIKLRTVEGVDTNSNMMIQTALTVKALNTVDL